MRRLTASLALLALPLLAGCEPSRLPLTPHFRILHSDVQQGATQAGAPVTRVVARVLVLRDSSPAALREQADGAIARLRRRYGAAAITLHITDSGLDLPLPGPQGVVYWEPQGVSLYHLDVRQPPAYTTEYRWAQKVTDPTTVPRPSDEELRFVTLLWRASRGGPLSGAEERRLRSYAEGRPAEALQTTLESTMRWLNY